MTTRKLLLGAGSLIALMALLHLSADDVVAQIKSAYMKNLDEPGRLPYQHQVTRQRLTFVNCWDTRCVFHFPTVPAGKRLVLEQFSVRLESISPTEILMAVGTEATPQNPNPVSLRLNSITTSGFNTAIVSDSVRFYFEPGAQPALGVETAIQGTFFGGDATFVGYLIDAVNR